MGQNTALKKLPRQLDLFGNENLSEIHALTWKQPFAALMFFGKKETRSWNTEVRGRVAICAAKKGYTDKELAAMCTTRQLKKIAALKKEHPALFEASGCIMGIGVLKKVMVMILSDENKCFVAYKHDTYVHVYENVVLAAEFIPFSGGQKWTTISDQEILKQLDQYV